MQGGKRGVGCSRTGEETGCQTNPDAQLDVFSAVDVHARVQQAELGKVVAVDHEGAADHGRSPDERERKYNELPRNEENIHP